MTEFKLKLRDPRCHKCGKYLDRETDTTPAGSPQLPKEMFGFLVVVVCRACFCKGAEEKTKES